MNTMQSPNTGVGGENHRYKVTCFVCGPRIYRYEGWLFEDHYWSGPWPLKKNGELRKLAGKKFFDIYARFNAHSDIVKKKYRVGGGCIPI